jgi:hypothetical protein
MENRHRITGTGQMILRIKEPSPVLFSRARILLIIIAEYGNLERFYLGTWLIFVWELGKNMVAETHQKNLVRRPSNNEPHSPENGTKICKKQQKKHFFTPNSCISRKKAVPLCLERIFGFGFLRK